MCQGAITIDGDKVTRNIAYYAVAHASKFVRPGSVRIASTDAFDPGVDITEDEERAEVPQLWNIAMSFLMLHSKLLMKRLYWLLPMTVGRNRLLRYSIRAVSPICV